MQGYLVSAPAPRTELQRIDALHRLGILDTEASEAWDALARLASTICDTPIGLVSLVDQDRQWFKARVGLDAEETPRDQAFCAHAILDEDIFTVADATQDARFSDNPLVTGDPDIRFYAGMPIKAPDGHALGTICVIDRKPRILSHDQEESLRQIGRQAEELLRMRSLAIALQEHPDDDLLQRLEDEIVHPMTPLFLPLSTLRTMGHDPARDAKLDEIQRLLQSIRSTIKDLHTEAAK